MLRNSNNILGDWYCLYIHVRRFGINTRNRIEMVAIIHPAIRMCNALYIFI